MNRRKSSGNWIKDSIDRSPAVTVIITCAAVLGFVISILNGGYTLWGIISDRRLTPRVQLLAITALNQRREVRASWLASFEAPLFALPQEGAAPEPVELRQKVPSFPALILVANPRDGPVTLIGVQLAVRFNRVAWHQSHGYVVVEGDRAAPELSPPVYIGPHEARRIRLDFLYIPSPLFAREWASPLNERSTDFYVQWYDDSGRSGVSNVIALPKGGASASLPIRRP